MSDTALTLNVPLSEADRAFLLIACGDITDDSTRSRPGAGELTAQGVLDLRARLKAAGSLDPFDHAVMSTPLQTAEGPLHWATGQLVDRFATALKDKLAAAEAKYGYTDTWQQVGWADDLRAQLYEHVRKGDPRDVAAFCAFAWHHGWSISPKANSAARVMTTRGWFPADFAPNYHTVAQDGITVADALANVRTLPLRHGDADAFAVNLRAAIDDDAEACGICDVVFIRGDRCLTDISLGPVHARCCGPEREGYVNLETGEPLADDAPIPTPWIWNADGTISAGAKAEPCHCITSGNGAEGCGLCNETGEVAA